MFPPAMLLKCLLKVHCVPNFRRGFRDKAFNGLVLYSIASAQIEELCFQALLLIPD